MTAHAHDVAKHILQGCIGGLNGERRSTWAFNLETRDRLPTCRVGVVSNGESVCFNHFFAVFGIGVDEYLQRSELAIFQSDKSNVLL